MRKLLLVPALCGLLVAAVSVDVAGAQELIGPEEYGGHGSYQCESPTHAAYYDPRRDGQTVYNPDKPQGDNVYYVDTNPLADFRPDGNYESANGPSHDCDGTPVVRASVYFSVTLHPQNPENPIQVGYPKCAGDPSSNGNPSCADERTGAHAAFFVAPGDEPGGVGYYAGAISP